MKKRPQSRAPVTDILEKSVRVAWGGHHAPRSDMILATWLLDKDVDFRCPPSMHQAFDLVFLMERDLGSFKQWPLILDESFRLLTPGGVIVLRFRDSHFLSIFQLANFIETSSVGPFDLVDQIVLADGYVILTVRLSRTAARVASLGSFSFALVTDGKKPAAVARFVSSVLALDLIEQHEIDILVCGPEYSLQELGADVGRVRLVTQPNQFEDRGWITAKKNRLVAEARGENILVAHDRYYMPPGFLTQIMQFGGDFAALVVRQETEEGIRIADWVMLAESFLWSRPAILEDGDYHPNVYLNGGAIIAKTEVLRQTPWSEFLFWNQAEDVELTRRLQARGVTPRLARNIQLLTDSPRAGYMEGFERLYFDPDHYMSPFKVQTNQKRAHTGRQAVRLDATPQWLAQQGVVLPPQWRRNPGYAEWSADGDPQFYCLVSSPNMESLRLEFASEDDRARVGAIRVNSSKLYPPSDQKGSVITIDIPPGTINDAANLHIVAERLSTLPIRLKNFTIMPQRQSAAVLDEVIAFHDGGNGVSLLGEGWHKPENWGVWAKRSSVEIVIGTPTCEGINLIIEFSLMVYNPDMTRKTIRIFVNRKSFGSWSFLDGSLKTLKASVPKYMVNDEFVVRLETDEAISPSEYGIEDGRSLSIGLTSIKLVNELPERAR